jgi:uncharacterized protein YbbC (DUF1343 family)
MLTGIERLIQTKPPWLSEKRIGLLCNHASIDSKFNHAKELVHRAFPGNLTALFSPQHGFYADKQDNMIESNDRIDPVLNIPVYSLYGKTRQPTQNMFDNIDVLIVDLQDVGTRVYTFIYTMSYCLEAAKKFEKKVLILDRPNPINGVTIEGNLLSRELTSFVGRFPIPMRHGLTIGELALLFNDHFGIHCDLEIISMKGWQREMFFLQTGLPWVAPSPNLPTPASAIVYPGQVIWEGTNISEGRGTTQPFELFGAPFLEPQKILSLLDPEYLSGIILRPIGYEPTSNKWQGSFCLGFQLHVIDSLKYRPYATSLALLHAIIDCHGEHFLWSQPPYEYDYEHRPIDLIIGDTVIREKIEALEPIEKIVSSWQTDLAKFAEIRKDFLLY